MISLTAISLLFLYVDSLEANPIKIQIDSTDILKIFGGLVNSENFKKFANQIVQRNAMKYGTYNNPYHPEDNIVENFDKENAAIDAHIEEENDNFISGSEDKIEDQLTEDDITKEPTDKMKTLDKIKTFNALNKQAATNDDVFIDPAIGLDIAKSIKRQYAMKDFMKN